MNKTIHPIEVTTIDGKAMTLDAYAGKTLLVVNVASKCGLTPQYEALEKLYEEKKDQGLEVLGFPCNEFGGQEPGTEAEIQAFCTANFGVKFPMFSKVSVNGADRHPLYQVLLSAMPTRTADPESGFIEKLKAYGKDIQENDIAWNFEKFLVNGEGEVVGHFSPDMTPDHPILAAAIDKTLSE